MKNVLLAIAATVGVFLGSFGLAAAGSTFIVQQGGTGVGTFPSSQLIYGNGTAALSGVATTSVTCSGSTSCTSFTAIGASPITISSSAGSGAATSSFAATFPITLNTSSSAITYGWFGLATTSQPSSSNLLVSNGAAGVYGVATSSETCTGPLNCTAHTVLAGGGAITITQADATHDGYLTQGNWSTFNAKQAPGFQIGTTSSVGISKLAYFTDANTTLGGVATTSIGCGTYVTCTAFNALGAASTIALNGTLSADQFVYTNHAGTGLLTAASSSLNLPNSALANSTIGATSPNSSLSFGSAAALGSTFTGDINLGHSNAWTVLQTFALASSTQFSVFGKSYFGGGATTTIDSSGNLSIGGTISGAGLSSCSGASSALTWNSGTSNFGCNTITGTGSGLSTTSPVASSNLLYYNATGAGSATGVATTTTAYSGPFTISGTLGALVGGANSTITWSGLSTTSNLTSGQLLYNTTGGNGVASVATTTPSQGLGITLSHIVTIADPSGLPSISIATSSLYSGSTGQFPYFSASNTITATSTIFVSNASNISIGTSTAQARTLFVEGSTAGGTVDFQRDAGLAAFGSTYGTFLVTLSESTTSLDLASSTGPGFIFRASTTTPNPVNLADIRAYQDGPTNSDYSGAIGLRTYAAGNPTERLTVLSNGRVGIGSTTPGQLLAVGNGLTSGGLYYSTAGLAVGSSTPSFPFSVTGNLSNLATTFYIASTGEVVGYDATNAWSGRISPTHSFMYSAATSTATWTASSTPGVDASPVPAMPFIGTLQDVRCNTNSFLGIQVLVNGSAATPSYFVASSTVGVEKFTAGNTFTAGQLVKVTFGTTTSATASAPVYASCTFDVTETP